MKRSVVDLAVTDVTKIGLITTANGWPLRSLERHDGLPTTRRPLQRRGRGDSSTEDCRLTASHTRHGGGDRRRGRGSPRLSGCRRGSGDGYLSPKSYSRPRRKNRRSLGLVGRRHGPSKTYVRTSSSLPYIHSRSVGRTVRFCRAAATTWAPTSVARHRPSCPVR